MLGGISRLRRRMLRKRKHNSRRRYQKQLHYYADPREYPENNNVMTFERLYGFVCVIRSVDRVRCVLGCTCDECGNKLQNTCPAGGNTSANRQQVDASSCPDNRVTSIEDGGRGPYGGSFIRRQTNEEFSSRGAPNCRTDLSLPCI